MREGTNGRKKGLIGSHGSGWLSKATEEEKITTKEKSLK